MSAVLFVQCMGFETAEVPEELEEQMWDCKIYSDRQTEGSLVKSA
jgi:hypothetical protein